MSSVHYFQRYSQKENVVTNNTLLLFSRLYNASPIKFKVLLNGLSEDVDVNVGVDFEQQLKAKNSIPDGIIKQESFKIAIETKLTQNFDLDQLEQHCSTFKDETIQVLLALGPKLPKKKDRELVEEKIKNYNKLQDTNINFAAITFKEIIKKFRDIIDDYDYELLDIIDDFEDFCISSQVIWNSSHRMLAVACGATLKDNFKNKVYYNPADRGYSYCSHLGIYNQKSVRGVGKIENVITADLNDKNELNIKESTKDVTPEQKQNIINMIHDAKENLGWNIRKNQKFFCVDNFHETDFKKKSKNGLFGKKYFNLEKELKKDSFKDTAEIAELLKNITWS
ncbi:hypothetical protein [Christiangramia portivictoriae]|uniref:hypothetical protein n=1 Tax=Christiangramia portivictoriae TaxID=326069 RepID=UPI00047CFE23|nr:hypothetical protein [Christiangramia portivictoriae]